MVNITEGTFKVGDEELYTKTWLPDGAPKAKLVVIHGFSDHINCYVDFFPVLAGRGIAVYGFDQRGWGRSVKKPGDRGRTGPTSTVLADMAAFITAQLDDDGGDSSDDSKVPLFVLGHSMGGNQAATLMAAPADSALDKDVVRRVRGWLLEAPFMGFAPGTEPSALKIGAGRLAGRLLPSFQLKHAIPLRFMTRDPAVLAALEADPLCHDTGTLEGLAAVLDRTTELAAGRTVPGAAVKSLWVGHGTEDLAASYSASKAWYDTSAVVVPDRTFRTYDRWLHQLHAEPEADRQQFYRDVGDWILERASPAGQPAPAAAAAAAADEAAAETAPAAGEATA